MADFQRKFAREWPNMDLALPWSLAVWEGTGRFLDMRDVAWPAMDLCLQGPLAVPDFGSRRGSPGDASRFRIWCGREDRVAAAAVDISW